MTYDASQSADERTGQYLSEAQRSRQVPEGFPEGWSQDTRAPFATYYNADGLVGVTRDEDNTNLWFPIAFDENEEIHKPLADDGSLLDWDTRPQMYPTPQEALNAALTHR